MKDPKAIRKAIMTAKSVARLIDPHFGRVPLPELGGFGTDKPFEEHSPMVHASYGEPMPEHFAGGGDVGDRYANLAAFQEGNHPLVPHVVYHGTDRNITQFDAEQPRRVDMGIDDTTDTGWYGKGHYFTPSAKSASHFASDYRLDTEHGPNVMPVHLSMKNPFIVKVPHHSSGATDMDRALDAAGASASLDPRLISKGKGERLPSEQTKILRDMGHDGVIVMHQFGHATTELRHAAEERRRHAEKLHNEAKNEYYDAFGDHENPTRLERAKAEYIRTMREFKDAQEKEGGEYRPAEFVAFEPHQIKSASGNRGTYDPSNPDIRYASGGYADGGSPENTYAQPDETGLYSHAAHVASQLPQERGTPEQFKGMLLNKGVKPEEFKWSEYDHAFGDKPQVTRDEVARRFHINMPSVEEKVFRRKGEGDKTAKEISDQHYLERQNLWDEIESSGMDPATANAKRREMNQRHRQERNAAWHHNPYHEDLSLDGGENYREILLKHGQGDKYPGVSAHFGGEPDVLTSLMVKDRHDTEGNKVLHLDELQSDWAQRGRRQGFRSPIDEDRFQKLNSMPDKVRTPEEEEELSGMYKKLQGIEPAPYVGKTEDWVDLGLKRALREAAEKGHDKLAWSPGSTIADRYNLAKHVGRISHEKNDDGTYNLEVKDKDGHAILDREDMSPEDVAEYFGKGVADQIFAGEGETGKEAYEKYAQAKKTYEDFMDQAASAYADAEMQDLEGIPEDRREHMHGVMKKIAAKALNGDATIDPEDILSGLGMLDDYRIHRGNMVDASIDMDMGPTYSPYRDWRHISPESLRVGEKWPFEMYDRMIPKRALRLAKMHDPEARLEKSTVEHDDPKGYAGFGSTDLHAIRITPQMRESILKKGFPAYAEGGEVEGYSRGGGDIDPELFRQHLKRIHSPLSEDPASVQKALKIAQSYSAPTGMETGVGSLYNIKQSMPAHAVTRTIGNIPGVKLKPKKQGSWEDFYDLAKGAEFVNVGGDLSGFGRLTHINGKPLAWPVDLHAGADYMREPNPGRVWANIQAHATGYKNKIEDAEKRGKELYGILSPMGPSAVNSSHNMFDTLMAQIPGSGIDPNHIKEFDAAIKRGDHIADLKKSKPKLFAEYIKKLEKWPGLEKAKEVSDFARPQTGNINGGHRTRIVQFMDQSKWRDRGFPEVGVTRAAITNPDLMGVGGNKLGHRVVKLSAKEPKGGKLLFQHSTYPVNTFGEYVMDVPLVQRHYAQPDVIDRLIMSPTKSGQIVHPYSEDSMGRSTARKMFEEQKQVQPVSQRFLDSVMTGMENQEKYGFKSGGTVKRALMIAKGRKKK